MALTINKLERQPGGSYVAPVRLYFTRDRSAIVEQGDPAAAFLAYPAGVTIPAEEAKRYGVGQKAAEPEPVDDAEPADDAAAESLADDAEPAETPKPKPRTRRSRKA